MVWSPDSLYVLNIDELKIDKSEEVLSLDWKLESVVKKYSFAIEVTDAEAKGIRLIDKTPRKGAEGMTIAFLHPKSTQGILTELCENKNK